MSGSFNESSLPEEFVQALESEIVDEFIQKPISNDKLIAIVEKSFSHNNNKNHYLLLLIAVFLFYILCSIYYQAKF